MFLRNVSTTLWGSIRLGSASVNKSIGRPNGAQFELLAGELAPGQVGADGEFRTETDATVGLRAFCLKVDVQ